ncbi:hypothetical protein FVA95_28985 [Pseudonocardia sp. EV170527-09]|uniref:hypothetical protein n=1 Tax=Pseudonocardia sp. EV170527-09 TaxID=2603411 RepID=UPI0011F3BFA6|nr:hypothetical protein [Pseudonocardia sp. EV170527-09]KAA1005215.1 hypothetical protein FVA95_28985 [Pseudonocardia sp. EV170527-09]
MELTEQQLVDELQNIAVATTNATLAEGGFVPPPTMHMFCSDLGRQPYAGYVRSRPYFPGDDAHTAVETLGLVASFVNASRVVLAWEQADLQIALQRPGELLPTGRACATNGGSGPTRRTSASGGMGTVSDDIRPYGLC